MCARSEEGDGVRQPGAVIPLGEDLTHASEVWPVLRSCGMPEKMKVDHTVTSREVDSTDTVTAFNECAWRARTGRGATFANPS